MLSCPFLPSLYPPSPFLPSSSPPSPSQILEGFIEVQLEEGLLEDAAGQIELLTVMHPEEEDSSPEFLFLQALVARQEGAIAQTQSGAATDPPGNRDGTVFVYL